MILYLNTCGGGGGGAAGASIPDSEYTTHNPGGWAGGGYEGEGSGGGNGGSNGGVNITGGTPLNVTSYSYGGNTYTAAQINDLIAAIANDGSRSDGVFTIDFIVAGETNPRNARVTKTSRGVDKFEHQYKATCSVHSTPTEFWYYVNDGINLSSLTTPLITGWICSNGTTYSGSYVAGVSGDITLNAEFAGISASPAGGSILWAGPSSSDSTTITITNIESLPLINTDSILLSTDPPTLVLSDPLTYTVGIHIAGNSNPQWFTDSTIVNVTISEGGRTTTVPLTLKNKYNYHLLNHENQGDSFVRGPEEEGYELSFTSAKDTVAGYSTPVPTGREIVAFNDMTTNVKYKQTDSSIPFNSTGRSSRTITLKALLDFTYTVTPSTYTPTGVTQDGSLANPYLLNLGNVDAEKQITINISDSIGDTRIRTSTTDVSVSGNTVQITSGLTTAPSDPIEIHIKDLISGTSSTTAAESAPANIYAEKTFYVKIVAPPAGFVYVQGNSTYNIPNLFFSDHEVTQGEFETDYTAATGSRVWYAHTVPSVYGDGDNYPVYDVSYYDALIYCNLRSMAEGLESCYSINNFTDPADWPDKTITSLTVGIAGPTTVNTNWDSVVVDRTKNGYRLPTEDEWLWAAKGGSAQESYTYSGGNDIDAVAWYSLNSGDGGGSTNNKSHPVKTKNPNSLGIYDMCGNVVELCDTPYSAVTNRVTRGGGYYHAAASANLNSGRNGTTSNVFYDRALGFRVVRTAP